MVKIVSKRERERIEREIERRVEEAGRQLAGGEDLTERVSRDVAQAEEDAWIEHILDGVITNGTVHDTNYTQTEDC